MANYLINGHTAPTLPLIRPSRIVARRTEILYAEQPLPTLLHDAMQIERWHAAGIALPPPFPLWEARPVGIDHVRLVGDCRRPTGRAAYRLDIGGLSYADEHLSFLQSMALDIPGAVTWLWRCETTPAWEG